jgi:cytochrome c biogenesis protein CcmG/thiol:disulfide interchange protein DsbE
MTDYLLRFGLVAVLVAFFAAVWDPLHEIEVNVGDTAPHFDVMADDGEQVSVQEFNGKALLLNFWASWCEPCIEETPSLNALARLLAPEGLVVLGISQDGNSAAYADFIRNQHIGFLTLRQPDKSIQRKYGTIRIPESYLIDRGGKIRAKFISSQSWISNDIVGQIRAVL